MISKTKIFFSNDLRQCLLCLYISDIYMCDTVDLD